MSSPSPVRSDSVAELCPACGLCCNGVLFADVELQRRDNSARLLAHGLLLAPKGRKVAFGQPCACFDGQFCTAYQDRPVRCRTFECRILRRLDAGELVRSRALRLVQTAQSQVEKVVDLLRLLGNHDEQLPLRQRYSTVMTAPIDFGAGESWSQRRAQLMRAMEKLMNTAHREFLT